jgi:hypothetical protein
MLTLSPFMVTSTPEPHMHQTHQQTLLLLLILDLSPATWGHRSIISTAKDKAPVAKNKSSAGPAITDNVIESTLTFLAAFCALNRENVVVIVGATETWGWYVGRGYGQCGQFYGSEQLDRRLMNDWGDRAYESSCRTERTDGKAKRWI